MNLDSFNLAGKVAVVTGSRGGLGQAMALALANCGADVVGINRSAPSETAERVRSAGRGFLDLRADFTRAFDAKALIAQAADWQGHVDVLVNNAGVIRRADALSFTEADWDDVMQVNLKTVFLLAQAAARRFVAQGRGGKIVNIASMLSFQGGIRVASYTASKSGVLGLTRLLANEWAGAGINVNAIAPGYMATDNTAALRSDPGRNAAIVARIPAGRWGIFADLAGPVVFLASSASDYLHGHTLAVDGGWLAR